MRRTILALGTSLALLLAGAAAAQQEAGGCAAGVEAAEPATQPMPGDNGTAPGNAGNTGWTGGLGGSRVGTNESGVVLTSKTWQPPTATGLDLAGSSANDPRC